MATKKQKMRAPADCRTVDQQCELVRDNISTPQSWILLDGADGVTITNQRPGESSTGSVKLSRAEFLKFAQWYTKPQRIVKRSSN